MEGSNSIINLGDISKPANTLIEKISDAIGGIFRPYQIRRVAQAEAEAEKIRATTQIEINELQFRAMQRFFIEEAKKQNNIESITSKALPLLDEKSKPEEMENDWITNFFDKCRLISDEEMQIIWARLLAGESNSPGYYSKRTIDLLASMDKSDADIFTNLCGFSFNVTDANPLIYDSEHSIYNSHGINFTTLSHLESIGLIHFDNIAGYILKRVNQKGYVTYFNKKLWIEFPKPENNEMKMGKVMLTHAGKQLIKVCNSIPIEGFINFVRETWESYGYKVYDKPQDV
jgi:hypothetical protein